MKLKKEKLFNFGFTKNKFTPAKKAALASFRSLFAYAETADKVLFGVGLAGSCVSALMLPSFIFIYGEFTTLLIARNTPNATISPTIMLPLFGGGRINTNGSREDMLEAIREDSFAFGYCMLICTFLTVVSSFLTVSMLNYSSVRQVSRVRRRLVRAVLEKDMAWYDVHNDANFGVNLTEDLNNMQEGMGEKIGLFSGCTMCFTVCVIIAFCSGWKLALSIVVCMPFIILSNGVSSKIQGSMVVKEQKAYSEASGVAEEVFGSIKTVIAFGGEEKAVARYKNMLVTSLKAGIKRARMAGMGGGIMWFMIYCVYALCFWYGVTLILESRDSGDGIYTPSTLIIVMFGVVAGSMSVGQVLPYLEAFSVARGSATSIFEVINEQCAINPFSTSGRTINNFIGNITFSGVKFYYPSRTAVQVLKGINLEVRKGEKVALVGGSGCGKSTCIQLIQRLYDPVDGSVQLDGVNLRELNIKWLRQQIGVVSQEPLLFATTIYENIRYGHIEASEEDIVKSAKMANAHDFIMKLPQGYQTMIGQRGTQLSGGQKQRIAIARAVVRDPKILLLDEATSALDVSNESAVQKALDHAAEGRTTIVVAHRLSTVKNADRIIVLADGQVVEKGTHDELISQRGEYYRLLNTQDEVKAVTEDNTEVDDDVYVEGNVKRFSVKERMASLTGEEEEEELPVPETALQSVSLLRILSYSKPEWFSILVGSLATVVVGCSCPAVAVLFGEIYGVLSSADEAYIRSEMDFYSGMLLVLAVSVGTAMFLQLLSFGHVASHLTTRLRGLTFAAILKQEPAWFDREENKVGALAARLSTSAADIQSVAGSSLSIVLQGFTTLMVGLVVSFIASWELTLMTCLGLPLIFYGVYYEFYVVQGQNLMDKKIIESATKVAVEAISGIRTVASLGREETVIERYNAELKDVETVMYRKACMRGIIYGAGQAATFLGYTISLWYGGTLVADDRIPYKDIIKVSESLLFGVWLLGQSLAFAPGFGKAKLSAARLFEILDRQSALKEGTDAKSKEWRPEGKIELSKVDFFYPNRPEMSVLHDLSLRIQAGSNVAFAGASGCGKSTIIQLIQRFYDPVKGVVCLDDENVRAYPMGDLRSYMSIVSQEPILFNLTIGENIAYGDNSRAVGHEEIVRAARTANIHNFISALPAGYDTSLGKGGTQLSGGQKQRVAIARALVRNPRLLLLDEATSALDTASEAVVQAALDDAAAGRTTITVGHRPASIAHADTIFVLDKGSVVEQGRYDRLLASGGVYANLNNH